MSQIKLETTVNGKIKSFSFYLNLFRNPIVLNAIKDKFFNEDNKSFNQNVIKEFIKKEFNENIECIDETTIYQSSFGYQNEDVYHFLINTRYNMMLSIDNNFSAMSLFLHVFCLPNHNDGKVLIIKKENLDLLVDALKYARNNKLFNITGYYDTAKQLDDFLFLFDTNELKDDVILTYDFYIDEDEEDFCFSNISVFGYDNVIDLLNCADFKKYTETFKDSLINLIDLNQVAHSYFEHLDSINKNISYEFKAKVSYIENNFDNVLLTKDFLNIYFVYKNDFSLKS